MRLIKKSWTLLNPLLKRIEIMPNALNHFLRVYIFFFFSAILFLSSCFHAKDNNKKNIAKNDTLTFQIDSISQLIDEHPAKAELYNVRANLFLKKQLPENARQDILKALSIDSSKAIFYVSKSEIYFALGKMDSSLYAVHKALSLDNNNKIALYKAAEFYFYLKKYDEVSEYISRLLEIDRNNSQAYLLLGMAQKESGDTEKAIKNFQNTLLADNNNFEANLQLGLIYTSRKNRLAESYYKNALNLHSGSVEALYALGMYYQDNEDFDKSIETYKKIISINPKFKFAEYNIGYIYLVYQNNYQEAKKYFSAAIQADSLYAEAFYNRGYCNELLHLFPEAKLDYKKALALKKKYKKVEEGLKRLEKK